MAYEPRITVRGPGGQGWKGARAIARVDLDPLFGALVTDPDPDPDPDALCRSLPAGHTFVDVLSKRAIVVEVPGRHGPCEVVVKCVPASRGARLGWLGRSRAHRAHFGAHRARACGIEVPRPLGYLERTWCPPRSVSFVVSERLDAPSLHIWCRRELWPMAQVSPVEFLRRKRRVVVRLADLVSRLHEHGLLHGDLHAGNILVAEDRLFVIDLESLRRWGLSRVRIRNFARLLRDFSGLRYVTRTDHFRFLDAYFRNRGACRIQLRKTYTEIEAVRRRRASLASC